MKAGFKLVTRLGHAGDRYPHILVDAHGWALRLGPNYRQDEKYYSNLPSLLAGLAEHGLRRRLSETPTEGFRAFAQDIKAGMAAIEELAATYLEKLSNERQRLPREAKQALGISSETSGPIPGPVIPFTTRKLTGNDP